MNRRSFLRGAVSALFAVPVAILLNKTPASLLPRKKPYGWRRTTQKFPQVALRDAATMTFDPRELVSIGFDEPDCGVHAYRVTVPPVRGCSAGRTRSAA